MSRYALLAAALIVLIPARPCFAVDAKQKMATCKFGADDQRLQGAARNASSKNGRQNRTSHAAPPPEGAPRPSNKRLAFPHESAAAAHAIFRGSVGRHGRDAGKNGVVLGCGRLCAADRRS